MMKSISTISVAIIGIFVGVLSATFVQAAQIFYESFEDPVVSGERVPGAPTGWVASGDDAANQIGLGDAAMTGMTSNQYAYIRSYNDTASFTRRLTTTSSILNDNLTAYTHYTLSYDTSDISNGGGVDILIELLAGTNVVASFTNSTQGSTDFTALDPAWPDRNNQVSFSFIPDNTHPNLGEMLAIRIGKILGAWDNDARFDNLSLDATVTSGDNTPPSPDPMLWDAGAVPSVNASIFMTATNASDDNLVQYLFSNTVNGTTSGWIDYPNWTDTDLQHGQTYGYKVKARDRAAAHNETDWSPEVFATANGNIILYESFEHPPHYDVLDAGSVSATAGWIKTGSGHAGLHDEISNKLITPYGTQCAYVYDNDGSQNNSLQYSLDEKVLEANTTYTLTFNAAGENNSGSAEYSVDLMAGTNTLDTVSGVPGTKDMSVTTNIIVYTTGSSDPDLGEILKVRLRKSSGAWNGGHILFDNITLIEVLPPPAGTLLIVR